MDTMKPIMLGIAIGSGFLSIWLFLWYSFFNPIKEILDRQSDKIDQVFDLLEEINSSIKNLKT
ncbi:hypothetical protein ES703_112411 [subsurface metagenome]